MQVKNRKNDKGAIQNENLEQLLLYKPLLSPLQAPYKHLPSNKSLRKTKQKQLQEQKARKNKTVVVVVKKFGIQLQNQSLTPICILKD